MIIIILDESQSMCSKLAHLLDSFNAFIRDQQSVLPDEGRLYLIIFNARITIVHSGVALADVPQLTDQTYHPLPGTALYDAIAKAVRLADEDKKTDERVICVVMTDGEENSSQETTQQQVKDMIAEHQAKGDWTFVYIGENPEQWARETGTPSGNVRPYDHLNVGRMFRTLGKGMTAYRIQTSEKTQEFFTS